MTPTLCVRSKNMQHKSCVIFICSINLQYHGIRLVGRNSKIDPEPEPVTTVLVRMPNRPPPELWYRAAKEINQLLLSHHHDGLSFEIIETDLYNGIYCSPVGSRVNVTVVRWVHSWGNKTNS
ncbi:hypothetical protein N7465_000056 [Penicillium sp. CMV-2018d]|nr:hypothetical protein N7465_000056 [Penicillium sp. CMV-2018d]